MWAGELAFVERLLEKDLRNNSAWHHRFFVVFERGSESGEEVVKNELSFAKENISAAPNNASAWNYLRGILDHKHIPYSTQASFVKPYTRTSASGQEDVVDLEDPLPSKDAELPAAAAIEFLADIYEAVGRGGLPNATELWKSLANEHDTIRKKYVVLLGHLLDTETLVQTTASDSALTAIVAARARYTTANPGVPLESLIIYVTSQTHSFGKKAALILGLHVRAIDVDEDVRAGWGLDGAKLRQSVKEDRDAGLHPFILVATVGTTSTGAIDRIADLGATIKEKFPFLWLHVDAAWAGVTLSCPEHREKAQLAGINEYADSLCVNFHKWGLTNFDCSALWVRDRGLLVNALDVTPEYLRTKHGDAGTVIDYRNWHLSLGRRFRSLKIWFVLRSFGIEGFQSYIRRCIALSDVFAKYIQESDIFDFVAPPSFALTVFRIAPASEPNADLAQLNDLNRAFHEALQSHHAELVLTQTEVGGVFCMRLAVGAARTEERDIVQAWTIIKDVAEDVLRRWKDGKLEPKN
ncbi:hypothetical protein EWM64_g10397 [Hericium alpestre]|uniref:Uncharacterized protein n=1 Tax=Hericium alpestre TaxID=135208 RepID=A0A4Y9ZFU9_9AGAM|nr:hypothetical protein EWM64_g10397 [Hericium alpestre]